MFFLLGFQVEVDVRERVSVRQQFQAEGEEETASRNSLCHKTLTLESENESYGVTYKELLTEESSRVTHLVHYVD
jgi:hypothetical protein